MQRPSPTAAPRLAGYCAYLVRLWQDSPQSPWRASVQSVQSSDTIRFADVEQLLAFLRAQTTQPSVGPPPPTADEIAAANIE